MSSTSSAPLVELTGVSKHFGGVQALKNVDLSVRNGTVIGIAGENGAGKSTLLKVLTGVHTPSAGEVRYHGVTQRGLSPAVAKSAGVAHVAQELSVFEHLSVLDNIILGNAPLRLGMIDRRRAAMMAEEALAVVGAQVHVDDMVRDLGFADRQLVEIAKALVGDPELLVLDEPTSGLREGEVAHLIELMNSFRDRGKSVLFITHRMEEFFAATDQMFIMRDGRSVALLRTEETSSDEIVSLMIGGRMASLFPDPPPRDEQAPRGPLLKVTDYSVTGTNIRGISLHVDHGEILGIAGLAGNGQTELLQGLGGVRGSHGHYTVDGISGPFRTVRRAMDAGVVLVPEDRKRHGLVLPMRVSANMTLPHLRKLSTWGFVRRSEEHQLVDSMMSTMQVRPDDPSLPAEALSGGNQQKVVIGAALLTDPAVCLFSDPTRGIDVRTKFEIYSLMQRLAARGKAVVLVSTDLAEITNLCNRVLVMSHGRIVAELSGSDVTEHRITQASFQAVSQ
ncbi:hypothetical protein HMPREF1531_02502 [Propionibacterium sp. oral taxon 192 str. F0372]|uniref:sugar ABC transporter ATP-binding protein n=1 Tax=Propionibacterium sp. oral taxon 192 TaxID=671222 RepID=UPI000353DFDD|nr:sugar ABC transporter ATP-binding protein [Propionibacterium sp. oral taxon 192]EPH00393.1 hypothetical protein HMPREF1531_02502 [Propionibacterium sp. oral taxon 192 str. F0372]